MDNDSNDLSDVEVAALDHPASGARHTGGLTSWLRSWPGRLTISALLLALVVGATMTLLGRGGADEAHGWESTFGLATSIPTGPIPPGGDSFIVVDTVPWGTLHVDGRQPMLSDQYGLGNGFTLARGVHHLTYQARYFRILRCDMSVPQAVTDTCPLAIESDVEGVTNQRFLDLQAVPANLEHGQGDALDKAISTTLTTLTASASIAPGERYVNQHGVTVTASAPLTFTVGVVGDQPLLVCSRLCVDPTAPARSTQVWYLNEDVHPTWAISDARGSGFVSPATLGLNTENQITFDVTLTGSGWTVHLDQPQAALDSIVQNTAISSMMALESGSAPGAGASAASLPSGFGAESGTNPAEGAIVVFYAASSSAELLLWRFGLLYATDTATSSMFPSLPIASSADVALARAMNAGAEG